MPVNNSKACKNTASFFLNEIYTALDYDPWEKVWKKLSGTQKQGVCLVAGVSIERLEYHEIWANFTLADSLKIQKSLVSFCSIAEKVRCAVSANIRPDVVEVAA